MNSKVENEMRGVVGKYLPKAIENAMISYELFLDEGAKKETDEFKKYHEACKVALAHVALLIKMGGWAGEEKPAKGEEVDLGALLENAQKEAENGNKYIFDSEND